MSPAERMLATMATLQDELNRQTASNHGGEHEAMVAANWRQRNFPFYRAVWVECAELLDHYGWKWWKRQHCDLEQVRLEVVDIWHFGLSDLMLSGPPGPDVASTLTAPPQAVDFHDAVESLAAAALTERRFPLLAFKRVMDALPLDLTTLFRIYVGKNMLNRLRQAHGYHTGDYVKQWGGREDNEHLVEIVSGLDPASADFAPRLLQLLEDRYRQVLRKPA